MIVVLILLKLVATLSAQRELNVTIIARYTPALDENPGKLGSNEFTAGSILNLYCVVQGSDDNERLSYSWTVSDNPSAPDCRSCYPLASSTSRLGFWGYLHSHHAGNYTCSVIRINHSSSVTTSNVFTVKVIGAGLSAYSNGRNSRDPIRPISNNGLIIMELPTLNCLSNSSLTGQNLGTVTTPDDIVLHPGDRSGDLLLHNPFSRPGALRFEPLGSNRNKIPLKSSYQGVYTCSIPDSNGYVFHFNIGMYPSDFDVIPTITVLEYDKEDETLNCVSTGSVATIVSWKKDGVDITIDGDYYTFSQTITNRRSSTYSNVLSVEQGEFTVGNYSCTVSNALGEDTMFVVIEFVITGFDNNGHVMFLFSWIPPNIPPNLTTSYNLICVPQLNGIPHPASVTLSPTVTDANVTDIYSGIIYNCSIYNYSYFVVHSMLIISHQTVPSEAPEMFTAVAGEREVVFSWSPPPPVTQRNGVITSYSLSCSPSPSSSLPQSLSPQSGTLSVTGFSPNTQYSCSLVAINSQGSGPAATTTFTTLEDYSLFKLHLILVHAQCLHEITSERTKKLELITSAIVNVLTDSCGECDPGLIDNQFFVCDSHSPSYLIYQARIEGTSENSSSYFISLIEDWVRDGAIVVVTGVYMTVDDKCSIDIASLHSGPECSPSSSQRTAGGNRTGDNITTAGIVGGIVAALTTLIIIIFATFLVLKYKRKRSNKDTNSVRMSSIEENKNEDLIEVSSSQLDSTDMTKEQVEEDVRNLISFAQ